MHEFEKLSGTKATGEVNAEKGGKENLHEDESLKKL